MKTIRLNENELDIIAHSLGINLYHAKNSNIKKDSILPDEFYRNYYCYGKEKDKLPEKFHNLFELGFIEVFNHLSNANFCITDKGIEYFRKYFKENITDKFKPLSRSKQKYQDYLHSEVCETFGEWLGIQLPKVEYKDAGFICCKGDNELRRYISTKYPEVKGEYCKSDKDAKMSYKLSLSKFKKKYKNNELR